MADMGGGHGGTGGVIELSWRSVGMAAALLAVNALVSMRLGLGLHGQIIVGGLRCVVQLSALGYLLVPLFRTQHAALVLAYCAFMVWVSAVEAIGRPALRYRRFFVNTLAVLAGIAACAMAYALGLVIGVRPLWAPQYLIPILGMLLGNTISGISVGVAAVTEELSTGAERVERLLAMGATRAEAAHDALQRSIRLAMTPLVNQLNVVGLVSIPGMMTGQILGGSDPSTAARYQVFIMFLLTASATAAAVASTQLAVHAALDPCHRLRPERLLPKPPGAGVNGAISWAAWRAWLGAAWLCRCIAATCCCCCGRAQRDTEHDSPDGAAAKQPLLANSSSNDSSGHPADRQMSV